MFYCVKAVRIQNYSDPYFPTFGLNAERSSVFFRNQYECGKIRTWITPNTDKLYTVCFLANIAKFLRVPLLKKICERLLSKPLRSFFQLFPAFSSSFFTPSKHFVVQSQQLKFWKVEHVQNQQLKYQNDVIVICSKLTIKTSARRQCHHSGIFILNFEHFSYLVLVFFWWLWTNGCLQGSTEKNGNKGKGCRSSHRKCVLKKKVF